MRILITGGAGFIGSHLAEAHVALGDEVVALDDLSTGNPANVAALEGHPAFRLVVGSILDRDIVAQHVQQCDRVYHLAAAVGVRLIVERPLECLTINVRGTENVVEMAARYRKKILITSSSEIYGKNSNAPLKEDEDRILGSPLKARWAYSTSKAIDEILAYTHWKEQRLPVVIVRLFNTVGPRQTGAYGMVLPIFVTQALADESLTVHGDGSQSRCFCHVLDTVDGLMRLMGEPKAEGEVFNLGSSHEVTMRELAERIIALTGSSSPVRYVPYEEAYETGYEDMQRRVPDTSKAAALVGFSPSRDLDAIVTDVIEEQRLHAVGRTTA